MRTLPVLCCVVLMVLCMSSLGETYVKKLKGGDILCCKKKLINCLHCPTATARKARAPRALIKGCARCLKVESRKSRKRHWSPIMPLPGV
ncbi:hypothetical protein chiPu_0010689 [Chiloscyllium punctatum]|uniref:Uncharacterized protein n=1 Tax=Chiloscyllium punctatum TaxID=137246 RepID=A0A401SPC4_CHIPU|nr:hypothetical protein [Chiloscyllium punctatum]